MRFRSVYLLYVRSIGCLFMRATVEDNFLWLLVRDFIVYDKLQVAEYLALPNWPDFLFAELSLLNHQPALS